MSEGKGKGAAVTLTAELLRELQAVADEALNNRGVGCAVMPGVLAALIAAARASLGSSDKRQKLLDEAARLLRNHVAGENVDDLMHYWADEWDATQAPPAAPSHPWVKATALPSWMTGLFWLQFDDESVGARPAWRDNGSWYYDEKFMHREHGVVVAFCKALPPEPTNGR